MKKTIAILILSIVALAASFALDFASLNKSAGGGLTYVSSTVRIKSATIDDGGFGISGFYDIQFAVFTLSYAKQADSEFGYLNFAALGKYPIDIGKCIIFPMAGLTYNMLVSGDVEGGTKSDMSNLGIEVGMGCDISVTSTIFIRPIVTYEYYLKTSAEKDAWPSDSSITGFIVGVAAGFKL